MPLRRGTVGPGRKNGRGLRVGEDWLRRDIRDDDQKRSGHGDGGGLSLCRSDLAADRGRLRLRLGARRTAACHLLRRLRQKRPRASHERERRAQEHRRQPLKVHHPHFNPFWLRIQGRLVPDPPHAFSQHSRQCAFTMCVFDSAAPCPRSQNREPLRARPVESRPLTCRPRGRSRGPRRRAQCGPC